MASLATLRYAHNDCSVFLGTIPATSYTLLGYMALVLNVVLNPVCLLVFRPPTPLLLGSAPVQ